MENEYNNCLVNEKEDLYYPSQRNSLYNQHLYDDQVAKINCDNKLAGSFKENFNIVIHWSKLILCVLFLVLAYYVFRNCRNMVQMGGGNMDFTPSEEILNNIQNLLKQ